MQPRISRKNETQKLKTRAILSCCIPLVVDLWQAKKAILNQKNSFYVG